MLLQHNKRGSNSLGLIGIVATIILFELLVGGFIFAIEKENVKNIFVDNCDCNYIGGCASYYALNGMNKLINRCESQINNNVQLKDKYSDWFFGLFIITGITIVLNIIFIFIIIMLARGVSD